MKIATKKIAGVEVDVCANSRTGQWSIEHDGRTIGSGDTMAQAISGAATALRKVRVRVDVPFISRVGERGVAYGLHAGNRAVMARVGGEAIQLSGYVAEKVFPPNTPQDVVDRYVQISGELERLRGEQSIIERDYKLNIRSAVEQAIQQKMEEAQQS